MKKKKSKYTKFNAAFSCEEIKRKLSGLKSLSAYSFTKRNNPIEFNNLLDFLPAAYVNRQQDNIESIDLVYSGSTISSYLLTIAVGRNDSFQGKEKFDIDVLNIAPDTEETTSYFSQFWHHFKDESGDRVSYDINPSIIVDEDILKDMTYNVFLTGSTDYFSFEDYQNQKPDFFKLHNKSFRDLNK